LFIWSLNEGKKDFTNEFVTNLSNRLWNLKSHFPQVIKRALEMIPVVDVPRKIRFGLARGTIFELTTEDPMHKEYIGFCINLASRLQKYCPELGFIASARLGLNDTIISRFNYMKVVATQLKGFRKEIVLVDESEYSNLDPMIKKTFFEEVV